MGEREGGGREEEEEEEEEVGEFVLVYDRGSCYGSANSLAKGEESEKRTGSIGFPLCPFDLDSFQSNFPLAETQNAMKRKRCVQFIVSDATMSAILFVFETAASISNIQLT